MEKERDGEAKLQGLVLAQGLQRCCWESPGSPLAGWGLWDARKQRTHLGSPKGCFPVGLIAGVPPWQGTLQPCSEGERGCKAEL